MIWVMAVDKTLHRASLLKPLAAWLYADRVFQSGHRRKIMPEAGPAGPYSMSGIAMESWRFYLCP